jgi:hypothetical protein
MKKYFVGLIAIILAVVFSAFTSSSRTKVLGYVYVEFIGDNDSDFHNSFDWLVEPLAPIACDDEIFNATACSFILDESTLGREINSGADVVDYFIIARSIYSYFDIRYDWAVINEIGKEIIW